MDPAADPHEPEDDSPDTARWRRWVDHGGDYRVLGRSGDVVTVSLLTCTGGEEMERIVSSEPALLAALTPPASPRRSARPGRTSPPG